MWFRHPHFLPLLKQWWTSAPFEKGSRMFQLYKKLQFLKKKIKFWNKNVFKNVFTQKAKVTKELEDIHSHIIIHGLTPDSFVKQRILQTQWEELCGREEEFWRQKS
jgi:hypothetical protein